MSSLELKIPPLVLVVIFVGLMTALAQFCASTDFPYRLPVFFVISAVAVALPLAGAIEFRRANTTVDPRYPERSVELVTDGIYRFTRNPMYLGFLLMLLACSVFLATPLSLLALPLFIVYMNRFQIQPEERAMQQQFGDDYQRYRQAVRRWL